MASPRPSNIPPVWENQDLVLYHGTTKTNAGLIQKNSIDLSRANPNTDFGRGFYTTSSLPQARNWAWYAADKANDTPIVLSYRISRNDFAALNGLYFVRGDYEALDYWSFIFHCRQGRHGHLQGESMIYYDVVFGPVAGNWQQRIIYPNFDQISFHTAKAIQILKNPQSEIVEE